MGRNTLLVLLAEVCLLSACTVSPDEEVAPGENYVGGGSAGDVGGDEEDQGGDDGSGGGEDPTEEGGGGDSTGGGAMDTPAGTMLTTGCTPYSSDVYTPFKNFGPVSAGSVATYPWVGPSAYPAQLEDFRAYGPTLPAQVECGGNKAARDHVDVTAGCLSAVMAEGDKRGQIQLTNDGYYRSFALPYDAAQARPVAWADQGVEYRFKYSAWTGMEGNPGFKAFVRYLTEYDLYVASWRRDGVVQIQKKQCGVYTTLKRIANYGAPSLNTWHTIKFQIVGNTMRLYLDGQLVIETTDDSITHGTAGIRIDSANAALIDDWRTYAP